MYQSNSDSDDDFSSPSFLQDVAFIRDKYKDLFTSLTITESDDTPVDFDLTTVDGKSVSASLSAAAYLVLKGEGTGEVFESFEQLLLRVMGPASYAALIGQLVSRKFNSFSYFVSFEP